MPHASEVPDVPAEEFVYSPTPPELERNVARPWTAQDQTRAKLGEDYLAQQAQRALDRKQSAKESGMGELDA